MTSWPYGPWCVVLRPEGSRGRVSGWVGAGEAEFEGRRRGAPRRDGYDGGWTYSSWRRWVNRRMRPQGLR